LLYVDDVTGTPNNLNLRLSDQQFTGGTTAALPTSAGLVTNVLSGGREDLIDWDAPTNGNWHSWYSNRGDVIFCVKEIGGPLRFFLMFLTYTDNEGGGDGDFRCALFVVAGASAILDAADLQSSNNWEGFDAGANNLDDPEAAASIWQFTTATNGTDYNGNIFDFPITVGHDLAARTRNIGTHVDVRATHNNTPINQPDDAETAQDPRRRTVDALVLYYPLSEASGLL
jgi:hypothetical protein